MVKNHDRRLNNVDTVHACDRRTDRQTDGQTELRSQRPCNAERRTVKITTINIQADKHNKLLLQYTLEKIRERTDIGTDSDSAPISVDRNRIRSNIRSIIDPSAICRPRYQLLHRMPPKPYNHKRHKAVIALCRVYKVPCRRREGEAVPCTASASAV